MIPDGETFLNLLIASVADSWPFTPQEYSILEGADEETIRHFAIGHVLRHLHKSMGTLEAAMEAWENGEAEDKAKITLAAEKLLVNALRLLGVLRIGGNQAIAFMQAWREEKRAPKCSICKAQMRPTGTGFVECVRCGNIAVMSS